MRKTFRHLFYSCPGRLDSDSSFYSFTISGANNSI